ncbi:MAG: SDR family NAD(P)-dependent oxidoreductase [Myxococcales bacterium]|nr:SDR family NAD(P)-dependent oxidoreductase [Myxococcales bacterium]MDH3485981.1 SDR family NAD(P)-dependent oxidoreductase [Myxococcales bacterium]
MAKRFENQVVWITGGGSGIGRALALAFAEEGATVAVSGRRRERLELVVTEIVGNGGKALAVPCDVTDEASIERAVRQVVETLGRLDVTVANAGFSVAGKIAKLSAEDWRRQLDVNVIGLAMTARYSIPHLMEHSGRLVLVGSVASMLATPGVGAYSASKYAVRAIGQTLAVELHGTGVSCTTIHPGFIESEIAQVDNRGVFDASREDTRPQKLMWPADRAAKAMIDAIAARKREHTFTGHGKVGAFVGRHLPGLVHLGLTRAK